MDARGRDRGAHDLELDTKALGEPANGELGRVVRGLAGEGDEPEDARDVDDVAIPRRTQIWQEGTCAVDDAPEVDVHDAIEVGLVGTLGRRAVRDARVVEDQVAVTVLGGDVL